MWQWWRIEHKPTWLKIAKLVYIIPIIIATWKWWILIYSPNLFSHFSRAQLLNTFLIVIPYACGLCLFLFWFDTNYTIIITLERYRLQIYGHCYSYELTSYDKMCLLKDLCCCHTQSPRPRQSFFDMTTTKFLRYIFSWHSSCGHLNPTLRKKTVPQQYPKGTIWSSVKQCPWGYHFGASLLYGAVLVPYF